jgi:hypothetical protein
MLGATITLTLANKAAVIMIRQILQFSLRRIFLAQNFWNLGAVNIENRSR